MLNFFQAVFLVLASILVVTRCAPFPQEDDSLLEEDAEYLDDINEYSVSLIYNVAIDHLIICSG